MLYFIDRSGHDQQESPYEVLAAVAVPEREVWGLIEAVRGAEVEHLGVSLAEVGMEWKGRSLLKAKTFRLADGEERMEAEERRDLARDVVEEGWRARQEGREAAVTFRGLAAYGQAVLALVGAVFRIMARFRVKTFAAIVEPGAPRPADRSILRRDYAFLFERIFVHLSAGEDWEMGLLAGDEREKEGGRILLLNQMSRYFLETRTGRQRSERIVPQPFFVHGDLTTMVHLADLVAYCTSWGIRLNAMSRPAREELRPLAELVFNMRYTGVRFDETEGRDRPVYGMFYLDDLRPRYERS